jgi:hypothetical protein
MVIERSPDTPPYFSPVAGTDVRVMAATLAWQSVALPAHESVLTTVRIHHVNTGSKAAAVLPLNDEAC